MDHPDDARVVRTRVLVPGSVKRYHLGSGYLVADEMVLTARHVLTPDGKAHSEPAGRCEVKRYGTEEWVRAEVGPSEAEADVALVRVPGLHTAAAVQFGRLGSDTVTWRAVGYPSALKDDRGRSVLGCFGPVEASSLRERGQLQLTVESAAPTERSSWSGMSGSVVFAGARVIGVIIEDAPAFGSNALRAARAEAFLANAEFSQFLGWSGHLYEVRAGVNTSADLSGPVGARRPSQNVSTFGFIEGFVAPPEPACEAILQALGRAKPAGIVVFTGHSGYGKTGLAGWAWRKVQEDFGTRAWVEFRDDWPKDVRGERAFEEFLFSASTDGVGLDERLAERSTLVVLDDVRTESDLEPFFPFFDRCTVLITALDSGISTDLETVGWKVTGHFDLTSSEHAVWVGKWARDILTRKWEWKSDSAVGDLVERGASWPLLAARLNREVRRQTRHTAGKVAFDQKVREVGTRLSKLGPDKFDSPGAGRRRSVRASVELMLQTVEEGFVPPPSNPGVRFQELGALPSDVMVPVEVLDLLWDSRTTEATSSLVEHLCDLGIVQFERPESGRRQCDLIRLHDSDREYLRKWYPGPIQKAHQRLLKGTGQGGLDVPIVRDYLAEHRIWHLIGAHDYESVANELTSPESLVSTALDRGVRAVEYDLALALAHCSSQLRGNDRLLRSLLSRIRQSIDLLERCDSRESFCPTLAGRLQGAPELADFAVSLGRYVEDGIIHIEGPPHDTDDRRLVRRLPKRGVGIKALSWMAEPDQVGIAFRDGAIRLWDPSSKRLHQSRGPDSQQVMLAAWASNEVLIAIGRSDGSITVWPLPDGDSPEGLPDQGVAAVAWSRTGELAYAGWAGALARWSRPGGTQWCTSNIGGARVTAMAWSDDSARLAFGSAQGAVFIFSEDGPAQLLGEHPGGVASLAWSARGRLACAGWEGTVRVLEPDARPAAVQPKPSDRRGPAVIAWDEDGHQLGIGGFDGAVAVWSAGQCRTVLPPQSGAVRALAWSPTAPLLAAGHDGGVVRIWCETDRPLPLPILAHQTNVVSVAWSSREEHLATAGSDGAVAVWAPFEDSGALLFAIRTHGPTTVRCSPDGGTVATAEQAGAIRLWDVQSRQCRTLNSRAAWTPAIGWAPVGAARLVTGGADGVVYEWNAERESDSRVLHHHAAWVSDLAWTASSRGEQLATLGRDWVIHINQPPDPACQLVAHEGGTTAMAWSPGGSLLATAGNDWLVRIWRLSDATSGTLSADRVGWGLVAQFRAHLGGVAALEWAPGGAELATAGWDRSVRRWRLQTVPEPSTQPDGPRPMSWCLMDTWWIRTSAATALAWSPDGASVVGGDRRGKLRLWRCGDLSATEFRRSHQGLITALHWPKRTNRILSAGTDGTLRVWDAGGQERARVVFRTPLYSLDLHEDSGLVAVGGEHGATILRLRAERGVEQSE